MDRTAAAAGASNPFLRQVGLAIAGLKGVEEAGDVAHGTISGDYPADGPRSRRRGGRDHNVIVGARQHIMAAGQPDLGPAREEKANGSRGVAFLPLGST